MLNDESLTTFFYLTIIYLPFTIYLIKFRKTTVIDNFLLIGVVMLTPIFLIVNDMFNMCENDDFIQLKFSIFLPLYKNIFHLTEDGYNFIRSGEFLFLRYPKYFWEILFFIDSYFILSSMFFYRKLLKSISIFKRKEQVIIND
jgi:hypothetical protein